MNSTLKHKPVGSYAIRRCGENSGDTMSNLRGMDPVVLCLTVYAIGSETVHGWEYNKVSQFVNFLRCMQQTLKADSLSVFVDRYRLVCQTLILQKWPEYVQHQWPLLDGQAVNHFIIVELPQLWQEYKQS